MSIETMHSPCFFHTLFFNLHLFLIISLIFSRAHAVLGCYTSFYSFGDSLIDSGNYLHIDNSALFGRFPYGSTFFHRPTGRCSNGRVAVDFIAEALGIPFLPPYLPSHSDRHELRHGANFAVAGATALAADFFIERKIEGVTGNISLGDQIEWFIDTLPSLCSSAAECSNSLRETLFLVGEIGVNDYCISSASGWRLEEIRTFVPQVVSTVALAVQTLIKHGATMLVVPSVMPLGCYADTLTTEASSNKEDYDDQTGCLKNWNELCQYHNRLLKIELKRLREIHPHATIIYADYYNAIFQVFHSPQEYGFSEGAVSACCGGGGPYNYNSSAPCGKNGARACSHPSLHWNWDGGHPTEGGHRLIADAVISKLPAFPPNAAPCLSLRARLELHPDLQAY